MKSIDLTMTLDRPLSESRDRIVARVDNLMHSGGYSRQDKPAVVEYQPRFIGLPAVWVIRHLIGERLTFSFVQRGSTTQVRAHGRIRNGAYEDVTAVLNGCASVAS